MIKKILSFLFFALAITSIIGAVANGSFTARAYEPAPAFLGRIFGIVLVLAIYVLSGLFLFFFDNIYKMNHVAGFKKRKSQCTSIIVFTVIFFLLFCVSTRGIASTSENYILSFIILNIPYFIPFFIFAAMIGYYVIPFFKCKKLINDGEQNEYFAEPLKTYSNDNSVLANSKIIFMSKLFCAIPLNQIASVTFKNIAVEQDVFFNLTNGKKIEIASNQKQYEAVLAAFNANK